MSKTNATQERMTDETFLKRAREEDCQSIGAGTIPVETPEQELKPCPFCGSDNLDLSNGYDEDANWVIICKDCKAGGTFCAEKIKAVSKWNTRTLPEDERVREIRKRLETLRFAKPRHWPCAQVVADIDHLLSLLPAQEQEVRAALEAVVAAFDTHHPDESIAQVTRECAMNEAKRVLGWDATARPVQPAANEANRIVHVNAEAVEDGRVVLLAAPPDFTERAKRVIEQEAGVPHDCPSIRAEFRDNVDLPRLVSAIASLAASAYAEGK